MNFKLKIVFLVSIPIVVIFLIAIISQFVALQYSKVYIKQFSDDLFEEQIIFSQQFTKLISMQLHFQVQKLPFYLVLLNSYYRKILKGKVSFNPNFCSAMIHTEDIYKQTGDQNLLSQYEKNNLYTSSWYQKDTTNLNKLDDKAKDIIYKVNRVDPLMKSILYESSILNEVGQKKLPLFNIYFGFSYEGLMYSNSFNSSLSYVDDKNCQQGLFIYDPRCRYWYINSVNEISLALNPPSISYGDQTPFTSQMSCQKMMNYDKLTNQTTLSHVLCLESKLSQLQSYFQNFVASTKQWYVIAPRTKTVVYDSSNNNELSNIQVLKTLQEAEFDQLDVENSDIELFQSQLSKNYEHWIYNRYKYINRSQMNDMKNLTTVFPYMRNGTLYYVILDPVLVFDKIPNYSSDSSKGDILAEFAYLQINIISDASLRQTSQKMLNFTNSFFLSAGITLLIANVLSIFVSFYYSIQIKNLVHAPICHLTEILNKISVENKNQELSSILTEYQLNAKEIFLSQETTELYESFQNLFSMLFQTSDNMFKEDAQKTLIRLCTKVNYLRQFQNYYAVGIIYNNIGVILLNQNQYFQALENFQNSIIYAKYEIQQFCKANPLLAEIYRLNDFCFEGKSKYDYIGDNRLKSKIINLSEAKRKSTTNKQNLTSSKQIKEQKSDYIDINYQFKSGNLNYIDESKSKIIATHEKLNQPSNQFLNKTPPKNEFEAIQKRQQQLQQYQQPQDFQEQLKIENFKSKLKQINSSYSNRSNIKINNPVNNNQQQDQGIKKSIKQDSEDDDQIVSLMFNLFYRKQNYIAALIAFQESLDDNISLKKYQQQLNYSFNFWKEIQSLLRELLVISKYLPIQKQVKVGVLTQISKCKFRINKFYQSEKTLNKAQQLLDKLILAQQGEKNTFLTKSIYTIKNQRKNDRINQIDKRNINITFRNSNSVIKSPQFQSSTHTAPNLLNNQNTLNIISLKQAENSQHKIHSQNELIIPEQNIFLHLINQKSSNQSIQQQSSDQQYVNNNELKQNQKEQDKPCQSKMKNSISNNFYSRQQSTQSSNLQLSPFIKFHKPTIQLSTFTSKVNFPESNQIISVNNTDPKSAQKLINSDDNLTIISGKQAIPSQHYENHQIMNSQLRASRTDRSQQNIDNKSNNYNSDNNINKTNNNISPGDSNNVVDKKIDEAIRRITHKVINKQSTQNEVSQIINNIQKYFEKKRDEAEQQELSAFNYLKKIHSILQSAINFTKAELYMQQQIYIQAAEQLTLILESNQRIVSHFPFRIINYISKIFKHFSILSPDLNEMKQQFKPNQSMQVAVVIQGNNHNKNTIQSLQLICNLVDQVLTNKQDQIGIVLLNQEDGYIQTYMQLTKVRQIKEILNIILSEVNSIISKMSQEALIQIASSVLQDENASFDQIQEYSKANQSLNFDDSSGIKKDDLVDILNIQGTPPDQNKQIINSYQQILDNTQNNISPSLNCTQIFSFSPGSANNKQLNNSKISKFDKRQQRNNSNSKSSRPKLEYPFNNNYQEFEVSYNHRFPVNEKNEEYINQTLIKEPQSQANFSSSQEFPVQIEKGQTPNHLLSLKAFDDQKYSIKDSFLKEVEISKVGDHLGDIIGQSNILRGKSSLSNLSSSSSTSRQSPEISPQNFSSSIPSLKVESANKNQQDRNMQFHFLMRKTIDQLFFEQMSFEEIKFKNFKKKSSKCKEKLSLVQQEENTIYNIYHYYQQNSLALSNTNRVIIYCVDRIDIKKNKLFDMLSLILFTLDIQLIIISSHKGNSFLEIQQHDYTYTYQQKVIIRVFYQVQHIVNFLQSQRNQFSKNVYTTYIQHF